MSAYLRDTLSPLSPAKDSPRDAARVLALKEKGLGLAVLETKDLAVRADEELALQSHAVSCVSMEKQRVMSMRRVPCVIVECAAISSSHFPILKALLTLARITAPHPEMRRYTANHLQIYAITLSQHSTLLHLHPHMTLVAEIGQFASQTAAFGARFTHLSGVDLLTAEGVVVGTHSGGVVLWLVVFLETTLVTRKF